VGPDVVVSVPQGRKNQPAALEDSRLIATHTLADGFRA